MEPSESSLGSIEPDSLSDWSMSFMVPYTSEPSRKEYPPSEGVEENYPYTCDSCPSRGLRSVTGDFASYEGHVGRKVIVIGYPDRCTACDTNYKRNKRAQKALFHVSVYAFAHGVRPSFVTFSLPTQWTEASFESWSEHWEDWTFKLRDNAMTLFKRRYKELKPTIQSRFRVHGGKDFFENPLKVTTSDNRMYVMRRQASHNVDYPTWCEIWIDSDGKKRLGEVTTIDPKSITAVKAHPHLHGVWAAPFIAKDEFDSLLLSKGLGISHLSSKIQQGHELDWIYKTSRYLSKYLTKEQARRSVLWGQCRPSQYDPNFRFK